MTGEKRLLIRPGAIGDFIVSLPALRELRVHYTEIWCAEQNVPLAGFADRALSIGASGLNRLGVLPAEDVIERLRGFDSIVSWYGSGNPDFRRFVGELKLPFEFRPSLPDASKHATEFYGGDSHFPAMDCPAVPRTFAVMHPFASGAGKRAPLQYFERIAGQLASGMPVHWLRGPEDQMRGKDAVFIPNLHSLACWLRGARIYVGNDSGISHLAAAVGTPVLAMFSTTEPKVWSPRGPAVWTARLTGSGSESHAVPAA